MNGNRPRFWVITLGAAAGLGCRGGLSDIRPYATPAPIDVQAEIRDARSFLAYPDETVAPPTGMRLQGSQPSIDAR